MNQSVAPETGDLVILKNDWTASNPENAPGVVIETRGLGCKVMWPADPSYNTWVKRSKLEVINENTI